jgi:hypothetical protein
MPKAKKTHGGMYSLSKSSYPHTKGNGKLMPGMKPMATKKTLPTSTRGKKGAAYRHQKNLGM